MIVLVLGNDTVEWRIDSLSPRIDRIEQSFSKQSWHKSSISPLAHLMVSPLREKMVMQAQKRARGENETDLKPDVIFFLLHK